MAFVCVKPSTVAGHGRRIVSVNVRVNVPTGMTTKADAL
jgi:hypothetical protein